MRIPSFRSLACVVLGSMLGILAATFEVPITLKAVPIAPRRHSAPTGPPSASACSTAKPSQCCTPGMKKEDLLSASPEAPKAPTLDEESDLD
jgi:hypothetical protein